MALSQQEIELLIKLRSDAEKGFQALNRQVREFTGEADKAAKSTDGLKKKKDELKGSSQAAGVAVGVLAVAVGATLKSAFSSSIDAANRLDSALIGLQAVAKGMGVSTSEATKAAQDLAKDGLMTVGEAASSLKNLLATGFSLPEAIQLMNAFRDSAAFNRQGMLGFGEAVERATQGVKFGNSALTDSTGLGKNLSAIMKDAGLSIDSAGRAAQDAGVRQAILNGFVKEGAIFQGNAAKYADTAAGKQAAFAAATDKASASVGRSLQPALSAFFAVAGPGLALVERFPGVFVALAGAITATVAPMVAMKTASALGIGSLGGLASTATKLSLALKADVFGSSAQRLGALGGASGSAAVNLGRLQQAALVAGAAFAGWQIGRWIAQTFDLDTKIANLTARVLGFGDAAAQAAGAKQDTINLAIAKGAAATISYSEAIQFNRDKQAAWAMQYDKSIAAQKAGIEAKVRLGELDVEEGKRLQDSLANEERRQTQAKARIDLATQIAGAEKQIRDEIQSTGQTVPELTKSLAQNEDAFKKWAEQNKLSEGTVKFLEESLKKSTEAKKKAGEEADKLRQKEEQLRDSLQQLGIVTSVSVKKGLEELQASLRQATKEGVDKRVVLEALLPRLEELATAARRSGVGVKETAAALREAKQASAELSAEFLKTIPAIQVVDGIIGQLPGTIVQIPTAADIAAKTVADSFAAMGIKTTAELQRTAQLAILHFQTIRDSGTATPGQIKEAFDVAQKAINEANGKIPTYWETTVKPGLIRTVESLQTAISGSFAQMLLGAKGFGEGFVDIWKSIKAAVLNIFNQIADAFIQGALKKILGALAGGKGGFGGGFGGLLNQALGLGGGGAAAAGGLPGTQIPLSALGIGGGGAGAAGGGAAAGGIGLGTILGGAGIGAGGFGLGYLLSSKFGKTAGTIGGGLGGAGTGALLGTMLFPGIGTGIGALIGGLGGVIGGLFGGGEGKKVNKSRDQFLAQFGGAGTGEGSGFGNLAKQLNEIGPAGDALFQRVINAKKTKDFEAAVRDVVAALEAQKKKTEETAAATSEAATAAAAAAEKEKAAREEQIAALKEQLAGLDKERQTLVDSIANEAPEEVMGVVEAETRARIAQIDAEKEALQKKVDDVQAAQDEASANAEQQTADLRKKIEDIFKDPIVISYEYQTTGAPPGGPGGHAGIAPGEPEPGSFPGLPGAAAGVFATVPTVRVFGEKEPELGGPVDFMSKALGGAIERLGLGNQGGGDTYNFAMTINALTADGAGLRDTMEREGIPMIIDAVRANRRQSRSLFRDALGVT